MQRINYDNKKFASISNSDTGEVSGETVFCYHQKDNVVTAEYSGGGILSGTLIAICDEDGVLDMRYQHVNQGGDLMTGICRSTPEILEDGRIRLYERWQWTCGDHSKGESIIEEIAR
ncbi:MAG: hypothetical protein R2681_04185 [Pyrinomonadaceae bacterium]